MGGHEAPPAPSGDAGGQRGGVGRHDAQHAAGAQQTGAAVDRGDRVVEVLDHVGEHDDVEAVEIDEGLDRLLVHVEPQRLAGMARGRTRELEPDRLVAARARLVEEQTVPAADVEQAPGGDLGADEVEQVAGGGAAPGLLAEVGVVAHVAVELVQLVAARQQRLLHGAALDARQQVAVAAGLVARGGEGLRHRGVPVGAGDAQAEIAVAYAAGGLHRRHGAGFPHERATLHVALRRQRRQAGRQRAPGQLGRLLEARVPGRPVRFSSTSRAAAVHAASASTHADDGVAVDVQVAGAAPPPPPARRPRRRRGRPPAGCPPPRTSPLRGAVRARARPRAARSASSTAP